MAQHQRLFFVITTPLIVFGLVEGLVAVIWYRQIYFQQIISLILANLLQFY